MSSACAWRQSEFIIFTFFDPCLSANTDTANAEEVIAAQSRFQKAKDASFNLLTATQFPPSIVYTKAGMDYALFIASKVSGLRYLVADKRWLDVERAPALQPYRQDTALTASGHYRNELARLYPSRRNALFGYNLGDEPGMSDTHNVKAWISHFKRNDESKLAYINLFPSYGFPNRASYEAYLDAFLADPASDRRPDVVCFDYYPFFKDGRVRQDYFYNLRIISVKAGERPFWAFVQSVDHLNYVNPSPEHFRFMVFCPVAYGARGIGYFTYEQPDVKDYRDALVNACSTPTPKYAVAQSINFYLRKIVEPIVMTTVHRGAFHKSAKPTGETDRLLTPKNAPLVGDISNENCLVGIFQSNANPATYYFLIVNKALFPIKNIEVVFKSASSGRVFKAPSPINYQGDTTWSAVAMNGEGTKMTMAQLQGGEGRFYKIIDVINPR